MVSARGAHGNELVKALHDETAGDAPRRSGTHKFYEGREEFKAKIDEEYERRFGNLDTKDPAYLSQRGAIVKELFEKEAPEVQERVSKEKEELHQQKLQAWEKMKGVEPMDATDDSIIQL
jgi:hypothetical protein